MAWSSEATKAKKTAQAEQIPVEWRLPASKLPSDDIANVSTFYKTSGLLSPSELDIVGLDPGLLLAKLASGSLTAFETTTEFSKAAAVAHQVTNCLTEMFFDRALARAQQLDEQFKANGDKPTGPLHGLPISLKDQFQLKGIECNMGIASWLGQISEKDSVLVTILQDAGAILHCRTNVPQALMFAESDNYIYGKTSNPFNRTLTAGGSSGGEGALVALHGSAIGVGTDLGGSVRIPAYYQGLYGLKPSLHRFPYAGARNTLLGLEGIASCVGPISRSLSGVKAFCEAVVNGQPWLLDPKSPEIPWRQDMVDLKTIKDKSGKPRKPVFGVMKWDKCVMPHPPMRRALQIAIDALTKAGYEIVEFEPYEVAKAEKIVNSLYSSDGGEDLGRTFAVSGEPWNPMIVTGALKTAKLSVYESWQLNLEKDNFREAFLAHWNATKDRTSTRLPIDGLLLPPGVATAHRHGEWHRYIIYTSLFNLTDLPAMIIPVNASVDPTLDPADSTYVAVSERDAKIQKAYSPELYADAPLSVQLVGRRLREEEVIGMSELVEQALKL